jgi:DNA-binding HxlR family transcriptional regulator
MANMETIGEKREIETETQVSEDKCEFEDYDVLVLMSETEKMRKLITKRGTLEIIMPLCCSTNPVRYKTFRQAMKGFSTRTLSNRLNELEKNGIVERHSYNEIPPRVEYRLTIKGVELVESVADLLRWMRKWADKKDEKVKTQIVMRT